jgi:hypothetical protein
LNNLWGMFQPDTMATYSVGGKDYIVTANEGDVQSIAAGSDAGYFFGEETRIRAVATDKFDTTKFPTLAAFKKDDEFCRLKVTLTQGRDDEGQFVDLVAFGGRSWSIWDADTGVLVWDSGGQVERISFNTSYTRPWFNGDGGLSTPADSRSDDKGPEPEGLALGEINGRHYLFGGSERSSMLYVWDITDPKEVVFVSINMAPDCADPTKSTLWDPEAMQFVPAAMSPTGRDLLLVTGARSGTLHSFDVVSLPPKDQCEVSPPPPSSPPSPPPSPSPPSPPSPRSPPPPSPSPQPAQSIDVTRPRIEVIAQLTMSGSVAEWASASKRSDFAQACSKSIGAPCFLVSVAAGSVVIVFNVVQYTDTDKGASIVDRLADPAVVATFNAAVAAATGSAVESSLRVSSTTGVSAGGAAYAALSGGAIAGIVVMSVVVAALIVGGGIYAYIRQRKRNSQADGSTGGSIERYRKPSTGSKRTSSQGIQSLSASCAAMLLAQTRVKFMRCKWQSYH